MDYEPKPPLYENPLDSPKRANRAPLTAWVFYIFSIVFYFFSQIRSFLTYTSTFSLLDGVFILVYCFFIAAIGLLFWGNRSLGVYIVAIAASLFHALQYLWLIFTMKDLSFLLSSSYPTSFITYILFIVLFITDMRSRRSAVLPAVFLLLLHFAAVLRLLFLLFQIAVSGGAVLGQFLRVILNSYLLFLSAALISYASMRKRELRPLQKNDPASFSNSPDSTTPKWLS